MLGRFHEVWGDELLPRKYHEWEFFESIMETLEIMGDPEMMAALRRGIKDVQEGRLIPLEEVKASLGID